MSDEVFSVPVDLSSRDTNSPGFWLSLASDVLNYGASFWERYFGNGSAYVPSVPSTVAGTGNIVSTGNTVVKSGNGGLIVFGAAVVILLLVLSSNRK
jgi:hypothetical protein